MKKSATRGNTDPVHGSARRCTALDPLADWHKLDELTPTGKGPLLPPMVTLRLLGGRKEKIRSGDVLGALTARGGGYTGEQIGKISVTEFTTFVAVDRAIAQEALRKLNAGKVRGKLSICGFCNIVQSKRQHTLERLHAIHPLARACHIGGLRVCHE